MILNKKCAIKEYYTWERDYTYVHQTERTELVSDKSTCDCIIAKRKGIFHVRIRVDFVVTFEIATLPIGHKNVVDYGFNL